MLDTLVFSLNAVLPLALLMGLGMLLRRLGVCKKEFFQAANGFSFKVLLPVMLFKNIYDAAQTHQSFDWLYVGIGLGGIALTTVLLMLIIPRLVRQPKRTGVVVQGIYRSNFLIFGIPVIVNMFGESELWATSMLIPLIIPYFNVTAVFVLEWFQHRGQQHTGWKTLVKKIFTTPLIVAALASFAFILTGLEIPDLLYGVVDDVAGLASPLALIALGGMLNFSSLGRNLRDIMITSVAKLILVPALLVGAGAAFGYTGPYIGALLTLGGAPTAVSSYVMAEQSGNDGELAAQIVAVTTVISVLTMFGWVFVLRSMGLL